MGWQSVQVCVLEGACVVAWTERSTEARLAGESEALPRSLVTPI